MGRFRRWLFFLGALLLPVLVELGTRVLDFGPMATDGPPPSRLCTLAGDRYSEGALVKTAEGFVQCRSGRWVPGQS